MIIIPARLASSRLKDKILLPIQGVPMFIATAMRVRELDDLCIGVDEPECVEIAQKYGFKAVLTSKDHQSGTDRLSEVCEKLGLNDNELIINIQADEPFIEPLNVAKFRDFAREAILRKGAFMASCYKEISPAQSEDANLVKVVLDKDDNALYFSRAKIPYERASYEGKFKGHLGIYAYSVASLREFCAFGASSLENAEKLEQLRALENGKSIKMLKIETSSIGIDSQEDYERALKEFC